MIDRQDRRCRRVSQQPVQRIEKFARARRTASEQYHGVFCPKCGQPMTPVDSHAGHTLKCLSGDMELSRNLHDRLSDVFINHSRRAESKAFRWGGQWFCPGCGTPMKTEDAHVRCETCGEYLDEFIHSLVELHSHLTRLILTVEDTFSIRERGVVLAPPLPASETRPRRFAVELHRPDGSVVWAMALVEIAISGQAYRAHLRLPDIAKSDVPLGTKVWIR